MKGKVFVAAALVAALLFVAAGPVLAIDDPFLGLTNTLNSSARNWAAALMLVGALIAGGAIMLGSHESGRHTRNFLFGAIFLVLAGAGLAIYDKIAGLLQ